MTGADVSALPSEVQLIPAGAHNTDKGSFLLDATAAKAVLEAASAHKNDFVIDYEHQTLKDVEAPAAGWIRRLVNKGEQGIWGEVEWTARAQEYLKKREYRYLSPVFLADKAGRVARFLNAALTNAPAIDGMTPVVNKSQGGGTAAKTKEDKSNMDKIMQALGLAPDAAPDAALAAIETLKAPRLAACKSALTALGLPETAKESDVTGAIMVMKSGSAETAKLAQTVAELKARNSERDAADLVAMAMKEGKVSPAMRDWALNCAKTDPEGFKVFAAKAPVVVPPGEAKPSAPAKGGQTELSETEMHVCKLAGVSKEDFLKTNKEGN